MDADAVYKEPSTKISRTQHVEDQPSNSMQRNSNDFICGKCDNTIPDFSAKLHCNECQHNFCEECISMHNEAISHIYLEPFETVCKEHGIEFACFCEEENCNLQICRRCAPEKHKGHKILEMNAKSEQCLDHFSNIKAANIETLKRTKEVLERLNNKKDYFEISVNEMRSVLQERRDSVIKCVEEVFNEQSTRISSIHADVMSELNTKIQELKNIVIDLRNAVQLDSHFPLQASKNKVIKCYQSRIPFLKYEIKDYLIELKQISVSPVKKAFETIQKTVKSMIGQFDISINGSLFRDNEAYATRIIHKTKHDEVQDICYDPKDKNIFATMLNYRTYYVLKFSDDFKQSFPVFSIDCADELSHLCIALLPNRCILLLYERALSMLSKDMKYLELPSYFSKLRVSTICSSPCLSQTFLYVYDSFEIIMYNLNELAHKRIGLPFEPVSMKVQENLDYIAFLGGTLDGIFLCSFKQGTTLSHFGKDESLYSSGCFLSEYLFIAYDLRNHVLDMFKLENLECPTMIYSHTISNLKCEGREYINHIRKITKKSSNSLYVCSFTGLLYIFYNAIF